jgi:hypothetical protein
MSRGALQQPAISRTFEDVDAPKEDVAVSYSV